MSTFETLKEIEAENYSNKLLRNLIDDSDIESFQYPNEFLFQKNIFQELITFESSFPFTYEQRIKEEEITNRSLKCSNESKDNINEKVFSSNDKKNVFTIIKDEIKPCHLIGKKKRRGRNVANNEECDNKVHGKYDVDNIISVVQVHYINFIVDFINCILKEFGIQEQFIKIGYEAKKYINNDSFLSFKNKKLFEILLMKISPKFTTYNKFHNLDLYNKIKDINGLKDILNINYLTFFREVYYKSERNTNIRINDKIISFSGKKLEMYKDKIDKFSDEYYKKVFEQYVNDIYMED